MSQKQTMVTSYFQHRRRIRSPNAKRSKLDVEQETLAPCSDEDECFPSSKVDQKETPVQDRVEECLSSISSRPPSDCETPKKMQKAVEQSTKTPQLQKSTKKTALDLPKLVGKVTEEEIHKKLPKVRNLKELRRGLAKFSEVAARLNEQVDSHNTAVSKEPTCSSSPKKTTLEILEKEPALINDESTHVPAYQKFVDLVSNNYKNLQLPLHYKVLLNTFRATDQLVARMYNRLELITFDKLKAGVQIMTRKNFERKNLAQMKTVYPEAYIFEQIEFQYKFERRAKEYTLTVAPNLDEDLKAYNVILSPTKKTPIKRAPHDSDDSRTPPASPVKYCSTLRSPTKTPTKLDHSRQEDRFKYMSCGRMVCRREIFEKNLFNRLITEHTKFLASLSPPEVIPADEVARLSRWHPKFVSVLDTVADIVAADLPEPPQKDKVYTAREILEQEKYKNVPLEVQHALRNISFDYPSKPTATNKESPTVKNKSILGVPDALLARIRAKESLRNRINLITSVESETRKQRLRQLPEMIKTIKMYFTTENKNVLPTVSVSKKLFESHKSPISDSEINTLLKLLLEIVPEWITETVIPEKGAYLRIDKSCSISSVLTKINELM